jgi:hypothetical protein
LWQGRPRRIGADKVTKWFWLRRCAGCFHEGAGQMLEETKRRIFHADGNGRSNGSDRQLRFTALRLSMGFSKDSYGLLND